MVRVTEHYFVALEVVDFPVFIVAMSIKTSRPVLALDSSAGRK